MAEEKKIATGYIGNALRSTAADHTTTFADEIFDTERQKHQNEVNTDLETTDNEIKADLEAETSRAMAAEEANTQAIENETARATAAEQAIIYDVSSHNDGAVFESLSAILSSSNLSTLIPTSVRHGGMTIRFILGSEQSSDNKYVQFRLMSDTFNTTPANWQGVDDEPIAGSDNLVKSGGVAKKISELENKTSKIYVNNIASNAISFIETHIPVSLYIHQVSISNDGVELVNKYRLTTDYIPLNGISIISWSGLQQNAELRDVACYDSNKQYIGSVGSSQPSGVLYTTKDVKYIRFSSGTSTDNAIAIIKTPTLTKEISNIHNNIPIYIADKEFVEDITFKTDGSVTSSRYRRSTPFIPVSNGDVFHINSLSVPNGEYIVAAFDSNFEILHNKSITQSASYDNKDYVVEDDVKYLRFSDGATRSGVIIYNSIYNDIYKTKSEFDKFGGVICETKSFNLVQSESVQYPINYVPVIGISKSYFVKIDSITASVGTGKFSVIAVFADGSGQDPNSFNIEDIGYKRYNKEISKIFVAFKDVTNAGNVTLSVYTGLVADNLYAISKKTSVVLDENPVRNSVNGVTSGGVYAKFMEVNTNINTLNEEVNTKVGVSQVSEVVDEKIGESIDSAVNNFLTEHPEKLVSVVDGSITPNKLDTDTKAKVNSIRTDSGYKTTGTNILNTIVGSNSTGLDSIQNDGNKNTIVGIENLWKATNASNNVAIGYHSQWNSKTGNHNISIGNESLDNLVDGVNNIAIGSNALKGEVVTTGYVGDINSSKNVAIGTNAMTNNHTGNMNIAIGEDAMKSLDGHHGNIAIGYRAGFYNMLDDMLIIDNRMRGTGYSAERDNSLVYGHFADNRSEQYIRFNAMFACNGVTPQAPLIANEDAVDLATAITLLNQIKDALKKCGIMK